MIYLLVCVRDSAAKAFARPFAVPSTGLAVRSFADEVNRVDPANPAANPMNAHPNDFELYEIGTFDEDTGKIAPCEPRGVARASDFIRSKE